MRVLVEGDRWIHGDGHYGIGNNIKILVRAKKDDPESAKVDKKQSGDYLIIQAKYVLNLVDGKVGATLNCAKFGNYQNDNYKIGGR